MTTHTQKYRPVAFKTSLGDDALLFRSCQVIEQLGRPFQIDVELLSEDAEIGFEQVVGQNATLRVETEGGTRYFNGYISRFVQTPGKGRLAQYRATLVPWLWLLSRTADCRIHQNKKVIDIVKDVCGEQGFTDIDDETQGSYRTWEYCVQYRETLFNFISRLLEQEGIYYYFEHEDGKHRLVLADAFASHDSVSGYEQIPYFPPTEGLRDQEYIWDWVVEQQVQPGIYAHKDFDFRSPKVDLLAARPIERQNAQAKFEVFDYPGEYVEPGDGETYASVRIQELQSQFEVLRGKGNPRGLRVGSLFELTGHPRADQNHEYLVTSAVHTIALNEFDAQGRPTGETSYECDFTAIDGRQAFPFRPPRTTPKPIIQGPQTAFVVGPKGEEIWTDEFGRVKVLFHWDRYGKADENSSCWIRVAQVWAGKKWGGMFIPRIGQEVIVEFLEGDPDRPIITGRVYNGDAMPPYKLPDEKTKSTLKSDSSKGSGGCNEIRFEDKKGDEQLFIQAEKNQDARVKNDSFEWVGNDRHLIIGNDQVEEVGRDRHETIKRDHIEEVKRDHHLKVGGEEAIDIGKKRSVTVGGDVVEVFKANHSEETNGNYYVVASNICIEGKTNVTIKVGGSYVAIEAGGIKIGTSGQIVLEAGATMDLKATGPLSAKSDAMADLKSPMTTVNGDGMLTLKGGIVMIN